jgi:NNP family nitrate/nitrite transporter-like MFS transporter
MASHVISHWNPEDKASWDASGHGVAKRNLWLSIPALTLAFAIAALVLAFAVWMVWSVVVVNLPNVGFKYSTNQLFWLAALPALCGATLRIFYSFAVPIFGGRRWTAISTATLLLPALGIGFAVQKPDHAYEVMVLLALLCGFGGGNFASSMANISFFFPKAQKGYALGMNAGLGNLGVSIVQFVVPLVITAGVFGAIGGEPAMVTKAGGATTPMWLQNAGFIWVPFIALSAVAAWFGMNDLAEAKASFADQAVIFKRKHNWLMCWLYLGTFGSFIGYSAGFPLLIKSQFPGINALQYAWLGPLVGALVRPVGGWLSRQAGRRAGDLLELHRDGPGRVCGAAVPARQRQCRRRRRQLHRLPDQLHGAVCLCRHRQRQHLPHDPGDLPDRAPARRRQDRPRAGTGHQGRQQGSRRRAGLFSSAIGAYGGFFIPKSYGTSIAMTGSPDAALYAFIAFYVTCIVMTWCLLQPQERPHALLNPDDRP